MTNTYSYKKEPPVSFPGGSIEAISVTRIHAHGFNGSIFGSGAKLPVAVLIHTNDKQTRIFVDNDQIDMDAVKRVISSSES